MSGGNVAARAEPPGAGQNTEIAQNVGVVGPGGAVIGFYQVVQYPAAAEPEPGDCPYKGLEAYNVQDAPLFFGREALTAKLVRELRDHPFLAIVGASGCGKSSLVRAGVVAALLAGRELEDGVLPPLGSTLWPWRIVTPTATPLEALARAVAPDGDAAQELVKAMRADPSALRRALAALLDEPTQRFLLVVDQLEELFTYCRDTGPGSDQHRERQAFVDNLLAACGMPVRSLSLAAGPAPALVILTLRADHYAACSGYDNLPPALASRQQYVTAMERDEVLRTVVLPAQAGGWVFQEGLVEQILEDAGNEPGTLPLLSHALYQTWNNRSGRAMTLHGYRQAGGVQGAIAATAEAVYDSWLAQDGADDERETARRIFLALVEPAEEGRATRRRAARAAFDPQGTGQGPEMAVLRKLSDPRARLVTVDQDSVQLAHEALIRAWPRLGGWLRQYRGELELCDGIRNAAATWAEEKDDQKGTELLVHKGGRLDDALRLTGQAEYPLTALEREYVAACVALRDREVEAERRRHAERVRTAEQLAARQRQARQRTVAAALIAVVALAAIALAILFFGASKAAQSSAAQARQAEASAVVAKDQEAQARDTAQADEAAARIAQATAETAKAEVERLARDIRAGQLAAEATTLLDQTPQAALLLAVEAVSLTRERDEPASAYVSGTLRSLVDTVTGVPLIGGDRSPFLAVAFTPDARMLVGVGSDAGVYAWDLADLAAGPTILRGHSAQITAVAFSPDGRWLVTASADRTVRLWDMNVADLGGEPFLLMGHTDVVYALAFSPSGRRLATASADNTARVWDLQDKATFAVLQHTGSVRALAFLLSDDWLVTLSAERELAFWDVRAPQEPAWRESFTQRVNSIAVHSNGALLAVGQGDPLSSRDQISLSVYDIVQTVTRTLKGHESRVTSVSFMPEELVLASASDDATVRLWSLDTWWEADSGQWEADPVELRSDGATIRQLVFANDGRYLAGRGDQDSKIRLWDTSEPEQAPLYLLGHDAGVRDIAFSLDVRWLASASDDGTIRLWDMYSAFSPEVAPGTSLFDLILRACLATGRNLTQQEWQQFLPDRTYRRTCEQWPAGE